MNTNPKEILSTCIGCGCDDDHACWSEADNNPCHWIIVDRTAGLGVCSACPEETGRWNAGDRTITAATLNS